MVVEIVDIVTTKMVVKVVEEAEVVVIPRTTTTIPEVFLAVILGGIVQIRVPIIGRTMRVITQVQTASTLSPTIKSPRLLATK